MPRRPGALFLAPSPGREERSGGIMTSATTLLGRSLWNRGSNCTTIRSRLPRRLHKADRRLVHPIVVADEEQREAGLIRVGSERRELQVHVAPFHVPVLEGEIGALVVARVDPV